MSKGIIIGTAVGAFMGAGVVLGYNTFFAEPAQAPKTEHVDTDIHIDVEIHNSLQPLVMSQDWRNKTGLDKRIAFLDALIASGGNGSTLKTLIANEQAIRTHLFFLTATEAANKMGNARAGEYMINDMRGILANIPGVMNNNAYGQWNGTIASLPEDKRQTVTDTLYQTLERHFTPTGGLKFQNLADCMGLRDFNKLPQNVETAFCTAVMDMQSLFHPEPVVEAAATVEHTVIPAHETRTAVETAATSVMPDRPGILNAHASGVFATLGAVLADIVDTSDHAKAERIRAQINFIDNPNSIVARARAFTATSFQQTGSNKIDANNPVAKALGCEAVAILKEWKAMPQYEHALRTVETVHGSAGQNANVRNWMYWIDSYGADMDTLNKLAAPKAGQKLCP